jgi:CheY-like chemotaxis protein
MEQLAGVRVLIVDDNTVNRRILNEACTTWGMQPEPADSGIVGLTLLRRAQPPEPVPPRSARRSNAGDGRF